MDVIATSAGLALCLSALATALILDRRPYRVGKRNHVMLMIFALVGSLFLARHLLTLAL